MSPITIATLAAFPQQLEAHYAAIPEAYKHWAPPSWDGIPSEPFTAIEQVCHVRDIEIEGYHLRLQRTLTEIDPFLPAIDSEAVTAERPYSSANTDEVFASFRSARAKTLAMIAAITPEQFARRAEFEGYGSLSLRSLVHFLCSHDQQHLAGLQWLLGKIEAVRSQ
ncbi:MAG TPA: DinB family protein [Arenimonas sp.]|uniref:DinB family protein n=1 Tax=Arenimonas sp. TaxID=1872635 RepID=UPI002C45A22B|nr:DinB family protein [Arenimonas sp.]HMB56492.1 DinB family protein [Arenimonas sp.]